MIASHTSTPEEMLEEYVIGWAGTLPVAPPMGAERACCTHAAVAWPHIFGLAQRINPSSCNFPELLLPASSRALAELQSGPAAREHIRCINQAVNVSTHGRTLQHKRSMHTVCIFTQQDTQTQVKHAHRVQPYCTFPYCYSQ
jgi:hypothetical protein